MPTIYRYSCTDCEFTGPDGWGYYMYAVDEDGERVRCPHPGEYAAAEEVLGDVSEAVFEERTGFNYHCVCTDCAAQFDRDPDRDELVCPDCGSEGVELLVDLDGRACPDCGEGEVVAENTGMMA